MYVDYGQFHGSKSRISIWKPNVLRTREFSLAQTWVVNGDWDTGLNTLESGWQVTTIPFLGHTSFCYPIVLTSFFGLYKRSCMLCMVTRTQDFSPIGR